MGCNCNDIQHQCGCLEASIKMVEPSFTVTISRANEIDSFVVCRADEIHKVAITPSCGVGIGDVLRFSQSRLLWTEKDNYVGNIKYNTLLSSKDWVLEEIEELL